MKEYIVKYIGFVIVEAENKKEAKEKAKEDETIYEEKEWREAIELEEGY